MSIYKTVLRDSETATQGQYTTTLRVTEAVKKTEYSDGRETSTLGDKDYHNPNYSSSRNTNDAEKD